MTPSEALFYEAATSVVVAGEAIRGGPAQVPEPSF